MKRLLKNNLIAIIITGLFFLAIFSPLTKTTKALAAVNAGTYNQSGSYSQGSSYQQDTSSYKFNMSNIMDSGLISAVIGCTGITNKLSKYLNTIFSPQDNINTSQYSDAASQASADNVPTTETSASATKKAAQSTADTTKTDKTRAECFNGIAMYLARKELADMTQKTVNWIDNGFEGDPFYVKDQESLYQSIKDENLTQLLGPFADPQYAKNYPYGRDFARGVITSTANGVQSGLMNTMNVPTSEFTKSFSTGGWNEWLNMTQNQGNNPLGFSMGASDYITSTIDAKIANTSQELIQNNGFLSQKRCVKYDDSALSENAKASGEKGTCTKWETVTPGSVIADQLKTSLSSPVRQLELANDINSSMNQVFSALIGQLVGMGLSGLDSLYNKNNTPYDNSSSGGYGSNKVYDSQGNDISGQYYDETGKIITINSSTGWRDANGTPFDITKDLGDTLDSCTGAVVKKGIISIQKDYIMAVKGDLKNGVIGSQEKMSKIMPALGELDYCIPGPNPSWKRSTQLSLNATIAYLQDIYINEEGILIRPNPANYQDSEAGDKPWEQLNLPDVTLQYKNNKGDDFLQKYAGLSSTLDPAGATATVHSILCLFDKKACESSADRKAQALDKMRNNLDNKTRDMIADLRTQFKNYSDFIESNYGYSSPMLKQDYYGYDTNFDINPNPQYLPMATAGLETTKNIGIYSINIKDANIEYDDAVTKTIANIYQLNVIKKKVDAIVKTARDRKIAEMKKDGSYYKIDPKCFAANVKLCDANGSIGVNPNNPIVIGNAGAGVTPAPCSLNSFTVTDKRVRTSDPLKTTGIIADINAPVTLSWGTTNCKSVTITHLGTQKLTDSIQVVPSKYLVAPNSDVSFKISAIGMKGTTSVVYGTKTITVQAK